MKLNLKAKLILITLLTVSILLFCKYTHITDSKVMEVKRLTPTEIQDNYIDCVNIGECEDLTSSPTIAKIPSVKPKTTPN